MKERNRKSSTHTTRRKRHTKHLDINAGKTKKPAWTRATRWAQLKVNTGISWPLKQHSHTQGFAQNDVVLSRKKGEKANSKKVNKQHKPGTACNNTPKKSLVSSSHCGAEKKEEKRKLQRQANKKTSLKSPLSSWQALQEAAAALPGEVAGCTSST